MLSSYLRFVLLLISPLHCLSNFTYTDHFSFNNPCQSSWRYLPRESICILFATSEASDVSWDDSHNACQRHSSELLTLENSTTLQAVQEKFDEIESDNSMYLDFIRRGAWIGKANWIADDLCDSASTTIEDLQSNCIILTKRTDNRSLCLKRALCSENHPFICQNTAMLEEQFTENALRWGWVKCLIPIWCAVDYADQKKKEQEQAVAAAAAAKDVQSYKNLFDFNIPDELLAAQGQFLMGSSGGKVSIAGLKIPKMAWIFGGGLVTLIILCLCCTACFCVYKKIASRET